MAFEFGILNSINPITATIAFVATVLFLLFFEFLTGALEYSIQGSPIYNQMVQKLYKELMIMGFVSFAVAMYQATHLDSDLHDLFRVTEFVHYILFFVAIFYVAHALYIMFISMMTSSRYEKMHAQPVMNVLDRYAKLERTWYGELVTSIPYISFDITRSTAEFKIINALFRDTYWLPFDFDFGSYLSGCLGHYSLHMINIGIYCWMILVILSLMNLARINLLPNSAFNCHGIQYETDFHHGYSNDTYSGGHRSRLLASSGSDDHAVPIVTQECNSQHVHLFLICGGLLCCYTLLLFVVAQIYLSRYSIC
jgi:hypothetical protein